MKKRHIISWMLYDFANSSHALMISTIGYALYFREIVIGKSAHPDAIWSFLTSLSMLLVGVLSPLAGAIADVQGWKWRIFATTTFFTIATTALLFLVGRGDVFWGSALFVFTLIGYHAAASIYNAFLPEVSEGRSMERISGTAWGIGYIGGIFTFLICYPFIKNGLAPDNLSNYRFSFAITAVVFLIFSFPSILALRSTRQNSIQESFNAVLKKSYRSVFCTLKNLPQKKNVFHYMIAYFLINDVITTIIYFTAIFARSTLGMPVSKIFLITLGVQLIGFPSTMAWGVLSAKIGAKKSLNYSLILWGIALTLLVFGNTSVFYVACALMGLVVGGSQSIARTLLVSIAEKEHIAEFFGFQNFSGRISSILGPALFGIFSSITGSQRIAMSSILVLLICSFYFISKIKNNVE